MNEESVIVSEWCSKGIAFYEKGLYKDALMAFEEAVTVEPQNAAVWRKKGLTLGRLDRCEDALIAFERSIEIDPKYAVAWHDKGVAFEGLGRHEEALEVFEKAIDIEPNNAVAWYNKGLALGELERYEEALTALNEAINLKPGDAIIWHNKGLILGRLGRYEDALIAFEEAISIDPKYVVAWHDKGVSLDGLERYEEALNALEESIKIETNYASAWYNKGIVLSELGRYEEALEAFEEVLNIGPSDPAVWRHKGQILGELGRREEEQEAYKQAQKIETGSIDSLGSDRINDDTIGRLEDALVTFNENARMESSDVDGWHGKEDVLAELGFQEEQGTYEQTIAVNSETVDELCDAGELLFKLCDYNSARQKAEQALAVNSNSASALMLRGKIEIESKNYIEAVNSFNKAITSSPGDAMPILWKAYARYLTSTFSLKGRESDEELSCVIRELERVKDFSQSHKSEILYFLGYFYYRANDFVSARINLEECLSYDPENRLAKELLGGIWNYKIRPSWWHWWLGSPKPLASRVKKAVFSIVCLAILAFFGVGVSTYGFTIGLVFLIFVLVSPNVIYSGKREIKMELRQPSSEIVESNSTRFKDEALNSQKVQG